MTKRSFATGKVLRSVHVTVTEHATYEFNMNMPSDLPEEDWEREAEAEFLLIGVAKCQCEVLDRDVCVEPVKED